MYTKYPPARFSSNESAKSAEAMKGANARVMVDTICAMEFVDESADGRGELFTMNVWIEAIFCNSTF
jgi:ethanolamine utilization protein EutP (predicted NTPase)